MKTKKLYIIRHGQTEYNLKNMVQGCGIDASLNITGKQQAKAFYEAYKNFPFDKVYTSALKRSQESVRQFIEDGIPTEALPALNEINWGIMEGKPFSLDAENYYTQMTQAWQNGDTHLCIENGESPQAVQEKQKEAIKYILSFDEHENILICMHGRAIRILLCLLLRLPLSKMDTFPHANLGLYLLKYENNKFKLEKANDISHLNCISLEK